MATPPPTTKMQNLKKPDGEPLWRKDIQFEFLSAIFNDDKQVFRTRPLAAKSACNPEPLGGLKTFSQVYIDAISASPRCSRVLRDKLLFDATFARNVGMVCLLVNMGRINTTLNFFVEMKAQLRTYHSIPSLQKLDSSATQKQLQDAPRLKSILKSATEDEPTTLEAILAIPPTHLPRTNPVNLVFVLSTYAPKVTELNFNQSDFWDLIMTTSYSSKSRAQVFLWLMWWWMHSPTASMGPAEGKLEEEMLVNPYGGDIRKAPVLEAISPEQEEQENIDTPDEIQFADKMIEERRKIVKDTTRLRLKVMPPKKPEDRVVRTSTRTKKRKFSQYDGESESEGADDASPPPIPILRLKAPRFSPTTQSLVEKEVAEMLREQLHEERAEKWRTGRIRREWKRKDEESFEEADANARMWRRANRWLQRWTNT